MSPFFQREADALHKARMGVIFCDYVTTGIRLKHDMTAPSELVPTWLENTVFGRKGSQIESLEFGFPLK